MENEEIIDLDCSVNMMWKFGRFYIDFDLNGFFRGLLNLILQQLIFVWFCSLQCIVTEGVIGLLDGGIF